MSEANAEQRGRGEPPEGVVVVEDSPERLIIEYSPPAGPIPSERDMPWQRTYSFLTWRDRSPTRIELCGGDLCVERKSAERDERGSTALAGVEGLLLVPDSGLEVDEPDGDLPTSFEKLSELLQCTLADALQMGGVGQEDSAGSQTALSDLRDGGPYSHFLAGLHSGLRDRPAGGEPLPVLAQMPFEDFAAAVFDHPVTDEPWYPSPDPRWQPGDPVQVVEHLIRLFERPAWLLDRYTPGQVSQGLGFLLSVHGPLRGAGIQRDPQQVMRWGLRSSGQGGLRLLRGVPRATAEWVGVLVAERTGLGLQEAECGVLPSELRKRLFESFYPLFRDLFARLPDSGPVRAWFSELLTPADDPAVVQVILATMGRILALDDADCQMSVLDGLMPRDYPGKRELVEEFLRRSSGIEPEVRRAAKRLLRGE